jgi:hypothetical protein
VDSTTQILTVLILLITMVLVVIITQFARRRRSLYVLRPLPAYRLIPTAIGESIEANRPVHISLGAAGLGGFETLTALAAAELAYQAASRAIIGGVSPIVTISDPTALPLAQDTLRRAAAARGLLKSGAARDARWYPAGSSGLAFAAALSGMLPDDRVAASILVGSFGTELALIAETSARRGQRLIAGTDTLQGQAVAYVMADAPLIGEEIYMAGAYLGDSAVQMAGAVVQDILRWLLILAIFVPTALAVGDAILNGRFSAALARLLGGG